MNEFVIYLWPYESGGRTLYYCGQTRADRFGKREREHRGERHWVGEMLPVLSAPTRAEAMRIEHWLKKATHDVKRQLHDNADILHALVDIINTLRDESAGLQSDGDSLYIAIHEIDDLLLTAGCITSEIDEAIVTALKSKVNGNNENNEQES